MHASPPHIYTTTTPLHPTHHPQDLDVDFRLQLEPAAHDLLMQQLKADADLLR
jgi:hypothetical protein